MQNERKRILAMLEDGTITTEDALTLLEKLGESQRKTGETALPFEDSTNQKESKKKTYGNKGDRKEEPSMDEFLEDLRKDFTYVGDRFMEFMQSAVQKVKTFDFESPFGSTITFNHSETKSAEELEEMIIDIDNGKIAIHYEELEEIRADFTVKTHSHETEAAAKEDFLDRVIVVREANKLLISSDMKLTQVHLDLYVPKKQYAKISARLLNGAFAMNDAEAEKVRVKTANGKIEVAGLRFVDAEFETANGAIGLNGLVGEKLEAESLNGRVYIDGVLKEVGAKSLSGHVVVTTKDANAERIEAKTMSGSVEIYIPSDVSLSGEIASNMGRLDLQLTDVDRTVEQEQFFQRTIRFKKEVEDGSSPLHIFGEAKAGSVLVCYNATHE